MLQRHRILQGDGQAHDLGGGGPLNVWKKANRKLASEKGGLASEKGGLQGVDGYWVGMVEILPR